MSAPAPGEQVSPQWAAWRATVDLAEYEARFARLDARGAAHGEADLVSWLGPSSVLDAGCGTGRLAIELARRGVDVVGVDLDDDLVALARQKAPELRWIVDDLATAQLDRRFEAVVMAGNVLLFCRTGDRRAIVHTAVSHLLPGGALVAGFSLDGQGPLGSAAPITLDEYDALCASCDLRLVERFATWERAPYDGGAYAVSVHRRSTRPNVHDLVAEARSAIRRVTAAELAVALESDDAPLVVDTRSADDRTADGVIPGSIHVPRTVTEWHLDPANGYRHPAAPSFDTPLVVVCNDGYSSSLTAANLVRIGFTDVADLIGGVRAYARARHPLARPFA